MKLSKGAELGRNGMEGMGWTGMGCSGMQWDGTGLIKWSEITIKQKETN
jgi:hypothetical protein